MWKHRWSVCAIALCLQCGGSTTPAEEPSGPTESTETPSTPEGSESPSESKASDESAGDKSEEKAGDKSEEKGAPAKKGCADLKKSDCKVTVGCAWNDLKKCVEEGPAE